MHNDFLWKNNIYHIHTQTYLVDRSLTYCKSLLQIDQDPHLKVDLKSYHKIWMIDSLCSGDVVCLKIIMISFPWRFAQSFTDSRSTTLIFLLIQSEIMRTLQTATQTCNNYQRNLKDKNMQKVLSFIPIDKFPRVF